MFAVLAQVSFLTESFCFKCQRFCPLLPIMDTDTGHGEVAGTTCVAWSNMRAGGSAWGKWLHQSTLPCLVWIFWVKFSRPLWFVHECVSSFDYQTLAKHLLDYLLVSINFSPKHIGLPANRTRRYTVGTDKLRLQVCRAAVRSKKAMTDEQLRTRLVAFFKKLFYRDVVADVSVYLQAPLSMVHDFVNRMASERGFPDSQGYPLNCAAVLSGAFFQRMVGYRNMIKDAMRHRGIIAPCSFLVNLQQTAGFQKISDVAPALLTKSYLCQLAVHRNGEAAHIDCRTVLSIEHFCIQSFPIYIPCLAAHAVFGDAPDDLNLWAFHSEHFPWHQNFMNSIGEQQIRKFTGNGMNLEALGSVLAFTLSAFEVTPRPLPPKPRLALRSLLKKRPADATASSVIMPGEPARKRPAAAAK